MLGYYHSVELFDVGGAEAVAVAILTTIFVDVVAIVVVLATVAACAITYGRFCLLRRCRRPHPSSLSQRVEVHRGALTRIRMEEKVFDSFLLLSFVRSGPLLCIGEFL